jgi:hypothetical protein
MRATTDRKRVIRITGLTLSVAGLLVAGSALVRFVRSLAQNAVEGSRALTHNPEYYIQIGAYYSRGFTTGFFVCYFLMLFAIIAGQWVDEIRKTRRSAAAAGSPILEAAPSPVLAGLTSVPK